MFVVTITTPGGPFVIDSVPGVGRIWLPEDGLERPSFEAVHAAAPSSVYEDGETLLAVRRAQANLPFVAYAQGSSGAALAALMDSLEAALWQYPFTLTLEVDGVAKTYPAWPSAPRWGAVDSGMERAHLARATCSVPVNPA